MQYRAFVSYAHKDERWAEWLQSALERYRIPRGVAARAAENKVPGRIYPVFQDRSELASSSDLSQVIREALDRSAALIVVCSPAATESKWVNEEIRYFQSLGRGDQIFCFLVDGSPERTSCDCAFPPALLHMADGEPLPDPLAADPNIDGKRGALLKIAAGLLDVGVDSLKQRDAQRQVRRRGMLAAASLAIAVVMLGFAITAQIARDEAEIRRGQAENLIGFMLGDLRARLEPIGRLDVLDSVGDEAMEYFEVLGERGTEQELLSRVMALRQIGEVRFRQGRLVPAQRAFEESRDLAESLLTAAPEEREYLFELGQAEFWVGYSALEQSDLDQTTASFTKYMEYSTQLLETDPDNKVYQAELSYAYSNLGVVAFERLDARAALDYFEQSVALREQLVNEDADNRPLVMDLGNGYSWLGATYLQLGQLEESELAYRRAVDILTRLNAEDISPLYAENLAQNAYHLGNVLMRRGELQQAGTSFEMADELLDALVVHDPENAIWRVDRAINSYYQGELLRVSGSFDAARQQFTEASGDLSLFLESESDEVRSLEFLALTERSLGLLDQSAALIAQARERILLVVDPSASVRTRTVFSAALILDSYGNNLQQSGESEMATAAWNDALELLRGTGDSAPDHLALQHKLLLTLDEREAAQQIARRLAAIGYRDPRFPISDAMR